MDCINELKKDSAYVDFEASHLSNTLKSLLLKSFEFLSPQFIIIHGSLISGKRYTSEDLSDIDVIIVSHKKNFWNLRELYSHFSEYYQQNFDLEIDITLISPNDIINNLNGIEKSSWFQSMKEGFSFIEV